MTTGDTAFKYHYILSNKTMIEINDLGMDKFIKINEESQQFEQQIDSGTPLKVSLQEFVKVCFLPSGTVHTDYIKYTTWRMIQRFLSSTSSVLGTQALLLAIGVKQDKIGG